MLQQPAPPVPPSLRTYQEEVWRGANAVTASTMPAASENDSCVACATCEGILCAGHKREKARAAAKREKVHQAGAVAEFLFTVSCACRVSHSHKHLLCCSSLPLVIAGQVHLVDGVNFIGLCTAALSITSIAYHATHSSTIRAADVLLLWVVGLTGTVQAMSGVMQHGAYVGWVLALLCIFSLGVVCVSPACHVDRDMEFSMITLPWHLAVHAIASAGLYLLAVGNASAAGQAFFVLPPIGRFQIESWALAVLLVSILTLLATAGRTYSGHTTAPRELAELKKRRSSKEAPREKASSRDSGPPLLL